MKKTTISISFEDEKLNALKRYMCKKNVDIEIELTTQLKKLYTKYVPAGVQEYINEREADDIPAPIKRTKQQIAE